MKTVLLRWQDWPLGTKSAAAVLLPMALLMFALFFSYTIQQQITAAEADVRRAQAIQTDIQTLHSQIAEAAMGVRGYLLTGRDDFLNPYRQATKALPETLAALRGNVRNPEVREHLLRIEQLWFRKQQSLQELIVGGRELAPADLQAHLLGSKGLLDELRAEIQAMYGREAELVSQYSSAARDAVVRNLWVDAVTSFLVPLSGVAAFLFLLSGIVRRVQRLVTNAERLSEGKPLERLPPGRDELGLLAERLQNASALLASRAEEAQAASRAKSAFLSRTSHELRTPLNVILGFAQILESDLRDTTHAGKVDHVLIAGRHLLSLIDEVLDIARIESGELKLRPEPLGLHALVLEAVELVQPLAQQRNVRLRVEPALQTVAVRADRQRLRQVLINLLSNAIKYNRSGGQVIVGARQASGEVWVSISDTGVGIRPELLPRLFSPFERLDAERAGVEGTGLGLAVSRQLVLQMGGDIEVVSVPGEGSEFSVRLVQAPLPASSVPVDSSMTTTESTGPGVRPLKVLVIEDNPPNLALLQALIARRPRWRPLIARDAEQGLALAVNEEPALVLLDLNLPGTGGEQVLAEIRGNPTLRSTPVVIISADAVPDTMQRLKTAGANQYLTKPLEVTRFLAVLDEYAQ